MTVRDVTLPGGRAGPEFALGFTLASLSTLLCTVLPIFDLTPRTAFLGLVLGFCPPIVLAVRSRKHPRLLHILTADIACLVLIAAVAHLIELEHLDGNHDLRAAALLLIAWLVIAWTFGTSFHLTGAGRYGEAAQRSILASLLLLLLALTWLVVEGTAFEGGQPLTGFYALAALTSSQLTGICFIIGTLVVPLALLLKDRSRRRADPGNDG